MSTPESITAADYHRLTRRPKYGNRKVEVDGIGFDSQREANRYRELCLMQAAGEIADLAVQPKWPFVVNGVVIGSYRADFAYLNRVTGQFVVEDVKSDATKTTAYRLRKRLLLACHGLQVVEV